MRFPTLKRVAFAKGLCPNGDAMLEAGSAGGKRWWMGMEEGPSPRGMI